MKSPLILIFLAITFLVGCSRPVEDPRLAALDQRVKELEQSRQAISNKCEVLATLINDSHMFASNEVQRLRSDMVWDKIERGQFEQASLDPESHSYRRLDTHLGPLFVSTESVEPYLDGYKVQIDIGNPSSAAFSNFKVISDWGPSYQDIDQWKASHKYRTNDITATLNPGFWTRVELVITPATAAELRNAQIAIELNQVFLKSARLDK